MTHTMRLTTKPFDMIRQGEKTIELRLYDEKRRKVRIGDTIIFVNTENASDTLVTKVTALYIFDSFEELYSKLPLAECGYTPRNIGTSSPKDMNVYYSDEQQRKYGVVGIRVDRIAQHSPTEPCKSQQPQRETHC